MICIRFVVISMNLFIVFFQGSQDTDLDEEMGLVGAVADDTEAEYIRYVCETEIINSDNLLGTIK